MTIIRPTIVFEMFLNAPLVDEAGNILTDQNGHILTADDWVDVSRDVLANTASWTRGNSGRTIFDRVANIGSLTFTLNNSYANENLTNGYYSPDHVNAAARFGLDTKVRITITEGSTTHEEWQGEISRIAPSPWVDGDLSTSITCEDWMAHATRDTIRGITVQTSKRDDQILTTLLTLASRQPLATSFDTGDDTYTYALHDENSLSSTLMRLFQKISLSGLGRIYLTGYSTLVYKSRSGLLTSGTPAATLNGTMTKLKVSRRKNQRVKDVFVTTYPAEIDASPVVLWTSQRERTLLAGESVEFDVSFRDPSGRATRIAALSLEAPTPDTDYRFSSVSGSGNDLNSSLAISVTLKADVATVALTNNAASTGYLLVGHQIRGTGVYLYEPVTSHAETGQPDGETINPNMVYQDDPSVGDDVCNLIAYWYVVDQSDVESVTFIANASQDLMDAAFLPPGSLVTVMEDQTGINNNFIINGTSKAWRGADILEVTWYPTYANQISAACYLNVVGMAELDDTAILGA